MAKLFATLPIIAAILYAASIGWMIWFTFAFFGFNWNLSDIGGKVGFGAVALSPIPVIIYCFRRARSLRQQS
ncbi:MULTISPECIES: hypothetical protein [unclassified Sphingomonas]|uniref:hypothetical protein n=1 Tax=unclassified Sphingomonas TaxID=196159 RepID=UPI0006FA4194|nr:MULTISPECIES: hypothetical protein [unclassified Sphingomonas]KQM28806.1 hypothetical protein ASE58_02780 [Sphingomonas sp. Leaf9]KQM45507.1 hypothetical protein ASE57_02770 [Sphingomonas sp. Leaf11]